MVSYIKSLCCSPSLPDDPTERFGMAEVALLTQEFKLVQDEIKTKTAETAKQLDTDPTHVDLQDHTNLLSLKINELKLVETNVRNFIAGIKNTPALCCKFSVYDVEQFIYKGLKPITLFAGFASFIAGVYNDEEGNGGIQLQITGGVLFLAGEIFNRVRDRLQDRIFRHNYSVKLLESLLAEAEKERKNVESLNLIFHELPKTLARPNLESSVKYVLGAIPEGLRTNFTAAGLKSFARRGESLPAGYKHGDPLSLSTPRHGKTNSISQLIGHRASAHVISPLALTLQDKPTVNVSLVPNPDAHRVGHAASTSMIASLSPVANTLRGDDVKIEIQDPPKAQVTQVQLTELPVAQGEKVAVVVDQMNPDSPPVVTKIEDSKSSLALSTPLYEKPVISFSAVQTSNPMPDSEDDLIDLKIAASEAALSLGSAPPPAEPEPAKPALSWADRM